MECVEGEKWKLDKSVMGDNWSVIEAARGYLFGDNQENATAVQPPYGPPLATDGLSEVQYCTCFAKKKQARVSCATKKPIHALSHCSTFGACDPSVPNGDGGVGHPDCENAGLCNAFGMCTANPACMECVAASDGDASIQLTAPIAEGACTAQMKDDAEPLDAAVAARVAGAKTGYECMQAAIAVITRPSSDARGDSADEESTACVKHGQGKWCLDPTRSSLLSWDVCKLETDASASGSAQQGKLRVAAQRQDRQPLHSRDGRVQRRRKRQSLLRRQAMTHAKITLVRCMIALASSANSQMEHIR